MSDPTDSLPLTLPAEGWGTDVVLDQLSRAIRQRSSELGAEWAFAHMDPPTDRIAAELVAQNAQVNQNLLHAELSPFASEIEALLMDWLAPAYGMSIGHMCAGSTLANLEALWCAREHGAANVVASQDAHISIAKAANILGMPLTAVPIDEHGRLREEALPDLQTSVLVSTAGTTGRGVIDPLRRSGARWWHVDAAWAGPLMFSSSSERLAGIDAADSVAISAHKLFFQPKDSALILYRDSKASDAVSMGGSYLATANVGIQGSRGANAIPLFGTLLAWGRQGLASRLDACMAIADKLAERLGAAPGIELKQWPETGVINWRPSNGSVDSALGRLSGVSSRTEIGGEPWLRQVAANPHANVAEIWARLERAFVSDTARDT